MLLINQHLERIQPFIFYSKAQNNNHGLSEAVALFLGGFFKKSIYTKRLKINLSTNVVFL